MDLRRRHQAMGAILDGKPLAASFTYQNHGIEWTIMEYAFAPAGSLVWLCEDKVFSVTTFEGDAEAFLQRSDLSSIAPEGAESIGLASADYRLMTAPRRKAGK